jgi:hypothetical protein
MAVSKSAQIPGWTTHDHPLHLTHFAASDLVTVVLDGRKTTIAADDLRRAVVHPDPVADQIFVLRVEQKVGVASFGWDMVPPEELIKAVLDVRTELLG